MKRSLGLLIVLLALLPVLGIVHAPADAQGACSGINKVLVPYAKERLTVGATAVGFTVATYTAGGSVPLMAVGDVQVGHINFYDDGSTPTSSTGRNAHAGAVIRLCSGSIGKFRAIRQGSTSAILEMVFYR